MSRFLPITVIGIVALLFVFAFASMPTSLAQPAQPQTATLQVTKSIKGVSLDNVVTLALSVKNNGTIPVFDIEDYEYMNTALESVSNINVSSPEGSNSVGLPTSGVGTPSQVIVDPPPPASLQPGESLTFEYQQRAPGAGDFPIPASLVWFSYLRGSSTIRSNYYSNGETLHIAGGVERVVLTIFPYAISAMTFFATLGILIWARSRLRKTR